MRAARGCLSPSSASRLLPLSIRPARRLAVRRRRGSAVLQPQSYGIPHVPRPVTAYERSHQQPATSRSVAQRSTRMRPPGWRPKSDLKMSQDISENFSSLTRCSLPRSLQSRRADAGGCCAASVNSEGQRGRGQPRGGAHAHRTRGQRRRRRRAINQSSPRRTIKSK
eukprot:SAG31_NODE_37_length_31616_cov_38.688359_18_plen_167_part_00